MAKQETDYAGLVEQAAKAVKAVTDPELRRIAFQKVLDDLLGGGGSSGTKPSTGPAKAKSKKRSSGGGKVRSKSASGGPKAYIRELIDDSFFKKPKRITEVKAELGNRGHHIPLTSLSGPLIRLCRDKELRRQKGEKNTFVYSNW
jgi:membrane protein involved in colicin uptake